jgi:hypothetical protein
MVYGSSVSMNNICTIKAPLLTSMRCELVSSFMEGGAVD